MTQLVVVPGAWFTMGSEEGADDEKPVHRVWVDTFEIGTTQVTNCEYRAFLDATGHPRPSAFDDPRFNRPEQPVVAVSWFDAVRYCQWLGSGFRLPTEAEWECAARGSPHTRMDFDNRWQNGPENVAQGEPNPYGLYDICENVHEWCSDWYGSDYYRVSPDRNPRGPETGSRRASRGGSWRHQIKVSRTAARSSIPPDFQYTDYGFRIAR